MKNFLIYVNPKKEFNQEHNILVKIQIDNSLSLGWKKEDILLATNFKYEYRGIKSFIVPDECYCSFKPLGTKTTTVAYLFEKGLIGKDLYWVHDFDAYQLYPITEKELDIREAGFTDYGWSLRWCMGSYFFRENAGDIFRWIRDAIYKYELIDEKALLILTRQNYNNINDRYKRLNITYDFGMRNVTYNLKKVKKPIRVIHFHPHHKEIKTLDIFMYGKNYWNKPLMTESLIKLFMQYGIQ